ncbi:hypothetical protein AB5N19_02461 [Seiridium cardinale]
MIWGLRTYHVANEAAASGLSIDELADEHMKNGTDFKSAGSRQEMVPRRTGASGPAPSRAHSHGRRFGQVTTAIGLTGKTTLKKNLRQYDDVDLQLTEGA